MTTPTSKTPAVVKNNFTTKGIVKKDEKPCDACAFKNHKINFILEDLDDEVKDSIIEWALDQIDQNAKYKLTESVGDAADELIHYECVACNERFSVDESTETGVCPTCKVDDYLIEISASEVMMDNDETETDASISNKMDMTYCDACGSSYTVDFIKTAGQCPICKAKIDVPETEEEDEGFIACPSCEKKSARVSLHFDNKCRHCGFEFDPFDIAANIATEDINIEMSRRDSGDYLDPDAEAIQKAIEADQHLELIPVPGAESIPLTSKQPRKPGVFASIFKRRNRKS
jgi:predicted Zn-ribbon and HTH transcriptional regulator